VVKKKTGLLQLRTQEQEVYKPLTGQAERAFLLWGTKQVRGTWHWGSTGVTGQWIKEGSQRQMLRRRFSIFSALNFDLRRKEAGARSKILFFYLLNSVSGDCELNQQKTDS
jgi:hypothetical protein